MIDLLVCNYNTKDKLERLTNTLWTSKHPLKNRRWTLSVADNGSIDGSIDWIKEHEDYFDHIYLNENIGYARAINQMAAHVKYPGDILAALNADVWFTEDQINAIQNRYDEDSTVAILGPKQRNEAGRIVHGGIVDIYGKPTHRGWYQFDIADEMLRQVDDVDTVSGSAYFVRRSVWDELTNCPIYRESDPDSDGAFLQTPHFYEETFCSVHALAHGYRIVYDGTVSIGHSWHASSAVGSQNDNFMISQQFFRKACAAHDIRTEWD